MKKLYAIRDKETGKIVNDNYGHPHVRRCPEDVFDSRRDELVTLRIEPTEPCEWCGDITTEGKISRLTDEIIEEEGIVTLLQTTEKTLPMFEWKFCPNCGRRLE